ncbi:hypothetical protein ACJ72_03569 [Emergomyces africanus]|uniref:Uncharacterized protein n=1 Tax=Emergomyces africanus TaxID=1955775 RepID=A0A1B7NZA5_9EURO|nr:hypothetical protein ACJ72_03569 [Emergomyces africanus]
MAHQAHNLPWQTLTSNFKYVPENPHYLWKTVSYWGKRAHSPPAYNWYQTKQLTYFANAFEHTIEAFSSSERAKYPTVEEDNESGTHALDNESEYISAATARKIEATLQRFRHARMAELIQLGPWQNLPLSSNS